MGFWRKIERARNAYWGEYIQGIKHYNWTKSKSSWLGDFVRAHFQPKEWEKISLVSVFGTPRTFWFHQKEHKIFFTGENPDRYSHYKNHGFPYVDLSLGFDYLNHPKYLRFPLWICYLFKPDSRYEDICQRVREINLYHPQKTDFCALITKHGGDNNLRDVMYQQIETIAPVCCGGKFRHNDDRLWTEFQNNKNAYLSRFKFSICPENSNRCGYVTEKLFECFAAGTVPIYWGSDNQPEPGLVNPEAMILWNEKGDNQEAMDCLYRLYHSPKDYEEFVRQPRLTPILTDYVWNRLQELEKRIRELI